TQEAMGIGHDYFAESGKGPSGEAEDEDSSDSPLQVEISDALSEKDKVKFTVQTTTSLPTFKKGKLSVSRQHEEFIWLHDSYVENEDYGGIVIPPAPPRPDFDSSREKLQRLGEGEATMTKEEFSKMKQELEAEYLAIFKKTVAMHEVFLCRLAAHPILSQDRNFHIFLEYDQELSVRGKNTKEILGGFLKSMMKSADEVLVSGAKDSDEFFEHEKIFLLEYHMRVKESALKADKMTRAHKNVSEDYIGISTWLYNIGEQEYSKLSRFLQLSSDMFEKYRKQQGRVASDQDLKLTDLLRYYVRETQAAKDLLYRRARSLVDAENTGRALDKARAKGKDVQQAEMQQKLAMHKFDSLSTSARQELMDFKMRRVAAFRKNLVEMAELELKHAKASLQMLNNSLTALQNC
uniref:Sorting nexin n=1 Tax=Petromyzon marinus TaxID=7757 RepID=S4RX74_PETMA